MKKNFYSFTAPLFLICVLFTQYLGAQQTVQYDNKTFGDCETIEAFIGNSGERFTIYIAEHELRAGYGGKYEQNAGSMVGGDFFENIPKGYDIDIEVFFEDGLKFPIKPEDSVVVDLSRIKHNLRRHDQVGAQIDKVDEGAMKNEAKALTTKKLSAEEQVRAIAEQMQQGKISPDEAMKKMEVIQNAMLAEIEGSGVGNMGFEEPEDPTNYSIQFLDTKEQVKSWPLAGELRIIRFDENVFEATFSGQHYVECHERRAASSREEEDTCKSVKSALLPDTQVLREGAVNFSINVKLKKFEDFRK